MYHVQVRVRILKTLAYTIVLISKEYKTIPREVFLLSFNSLNTFHVKHTSINHAVFQMH